MQWAISIGHFDISTAIMTMSGFRAQPCHGHLDHVKHIYGYLFKMKDAKIVVHTEEMDYAEIPVNEYEWSHSVYGDVKELTQRMLTSHLASLQCCCITLMLTCFMI